jgi:hypothetical protein
MVPGDVDDEPGRDGDGEEHEEEGQGENGFRSSVRFGVRREASRGPFVRVRHVGLQSSFLVGSDEVFSGFFSEPFPEAPFEESPLVAVSFDSGFGPFLL